MSNETVTINLEFYDKRTAKIKELKSQLKESKFEISKKDRSIHFLEGLRGDKDTDIGDLKEKLKQSESEKENYKNKWDLCDKMSTEYFGKLKQSEERLAKAVEYLKRINTWGLSVTTDKGIAKFLEELNETN